MESEQDKDHGEDKDRDQDKRNSRFTVPGDPPIIVGGGGSSLVWIRRDQAPQLIDPATLQGQQPTRPTTPGLYYCFRLRDNHVRMQTDDGINQAEPRKPVNGRFHVTYFDERE